MKRGTGAHRLLAAATLCLAAGVAPAADNEWTLKKALKQMDRAVKQRAGVSGTIEYEELYRSRTVSGSGEIHVRFDGKVRAEIGGSSPRTFLLKPPYLQIYHPVNETVEVMTPGTNPDMLAQYALLGFAPAGSAIKRDYDMTLFEQTVRDGRTLLVFDLKPKDKRARDIVTKIRLTIDTESWLPVEQLLFHAPSGIQVTVRYSNLRAADPPLEVFKSDWPEGTKVIRRDP
jgi:outer membrane lipoprotein-sorting protein